MPRYFFDTADGDRRLTDDEGLDLSGPEDARRAAIDALPDMARDALPNGDRHDFSVHVRDEAGAVIYTASLALTSEWHITRPP